MQRERWGKAKLALCAKGTGVLNKGWFRKMKQEVIGQVKKFMSVFVSVCTMHIILLI